MLEKDETNMSASSEKKRRLDERAQGIDKRADAQREESKKKSESKRNWTLGTIAIVLLLAVIVFLNTSLPFNMTAVKVGADTYSAAEMNYFYTNSYYNNLNTMASLGVDLRRPLASQSCLLMEDGTWRDYIIEDAVASVTSMNTVYNEAMAQGYELSEEGKAAIEENMANLPAIAEQNGFTSVKKYLRAVYGTGVTEAVVRDMMTKATVVTEYSQSIVDGFTYTTDEQEAYFAEHRDDFVAYAYEYYFVAGETEEVTDAEGNTSSALKEGALEATQTAAQEIAAEATSTEAFSAAVAAHQEGATIQTASATTKANIYELYRDWVTDSSRKTGDVTTMSNDNGTYIVRYVGMDDHHYNAVAMRHILIESVDADQNHEYSAEEMQLAEDKIKEIEAEWNAGEQTEEAFAALAEKYSEDAGSNTNGGLYEHIGKHTMVSDIDEYLFANGRKAGDTAILHGNNGYYDGYHLVYFVGAEGPYYLTLANNALVNEAYSAWDTALMEGVESDTTFCARFIGK